MDKGSRDYTNFLDGDMFEPGRRQNDENDLDDDYPSSGSDEPQIPSEGKSAARIRPSLIPEDLSYSLSDSDQEIAFEISSDADLDLESGSPQSESGQSEANPFDLADDSDPEIPDEAEMPLTPLEELSATLLSEYVMCPPTSPFRMSLHCRFAPMASKVLKSDSVPSMTPFSEDMNDRASTLGIRSISSPQDSMRILHKPPTYPAKPAFRPNRRSSAAEKKELWRRWYWITQGEKKMERMGKDKKLAKELYQKRINDQFPWTQPPARRRKSAHVRQKSFPGSSPSIEDHRYMRTAPSPILLDPTQPLTVSGTERLLQERLLQQRPRFKSVYRTYSDDAL